MAVSADAIVIGAGVIGSAVGLELARAGRRVINVDAAPTSGYGSTSGSCAIIRTYYSTLDGSALAYEGYHYWRDWADYLAASDEAGHAEFRETGALVMKTEENGHLARVMEMTEKVGCPYEEWDAQTIAERMPHYDLGRFAPARLPEDPSFGERDGEIAGAVFFPHAGYVTDPQLSAHNLHRAAEAAGASFRFNARVVEILKRAEGGVMGVRLADGDEIHAPVVINVAGPHSAKVNALAGATDDMKITTRALKQEVVHVPAPVENWDRDGFVTSDSDISCYTRPEKGNYLLIGSEDPPCDPREYVDPDDWDRNFTEQWRRQALRAAQRIPSLRIPSAMRGVVDLYDVTEDWIPIYDKSCVPGFYMAVGSSGNQYKNAPIAGAMMAALIEACESGFDHDAQAFRFRLPRLDMEIDLATFSRLREINPDSSFSVLG